uniref:Major facilitator superfamily (MFS) profile domain-containing protein n=1 Tax=Mucochytrium quahogii TaxID=96639 RepID=A0A7S2RHX8_9STRA|mmetsp:Transcript_10993/g.20349  ORF Transcript_10993/g.20349 Transcript_10993/m.20349 type:complete len:470 (-) Transcript_10993:545-1954(-)
MYRLSVYSLCGISLVSSCIDGAIIPLVMSLAINYGDGSEWWVPVLASAFRMGTVFGLPTLGWLADKFGYRAIGIVALAFSVLFSFACIFVEDLILLAILRVGLGFFAFDLIGTNWINRNSIAPIQRRKNLALYGLMLPIGVVLGMVVSGVVDSAETKYYSWKIVNIFWCVALFLALIVLVNFVKPPMTNEEIERETGLNQSSHEQDNVPNPSETTKQRHTGWKAKSEELTASLSQRHDGKSHSLFGTLWRNINHFFLCVCFGITGGLLVTLVVMLCVEKLEFSSLDVSLTFVGFVGSAMAFVFLIYPQMVKRIGLVYTLVILMCSVTIIDAATAIVYFFDVSFLVVLVLSFVHYAGSISGETSNKTLLLEQVPLAIEGRVMGLFLSTRQCSMVVGSYGSVFLYKDAATYAPWLAKTFLQLFGLALFCNRFFWARRGPSEDSESVGLDLSGISLQASQDAKSEKSALEAI